MPKTPYRFFPPQYFRFLDRFEANGPFVYGPCSETEIRSTRQAFYRLKHALLDAPPDDTHAEGYIKIFDGLKLEAKLDGDRSYLHFNYSPMLAWERSQTNA